MSRFTTHPIRTSLIVSILVALLSLPALVLAGPKSINKVNGAIRTEAGVDYGDLSTVNGSIRLASTATAHSVETVNGSIAIDDQAKLGNAETVNGSITARSGAEIEEGVSTVNGSITLETGATVGGRVETVNGAIRMNTAQIGAGIETVNGDIEVMDGSVVRGGILMREPKGSWFNRGTPRVPKVVIGANSVIEGELVFEREVELRVHSSARIGRVTGATVEAL